MTNVKKFTAKVTALLLALSLALLSVPQVSFTVFADDDLGSVRVIVENTTFTEAVSGGEAPAGQAPRLTSGYRLTRPQVQ